MTLVSWFHVVQVSGREVFEFRPELVKDEADETKTPNMMQVLHPKVTQMVKCF